MKKEKKEKRKKKKEKRKKKNEKNALSFTNRKLSENNLCFKGTIFVFP